MPAATRTLFDFTRPDAADGWTSVDDVVMGGVSESRFVSTENGAAFVGTVSLEQGGGFASVRGPAGPYDWSDAQALRWRARGSAKRFQLVLHPADGRGVTYRAAFTATADWTTHTVALDALEPRRRGQAVPDAPPLDRSHVETLGWLIADRQAGDFRLELQGVQAVLA
jgi:monofunctional biosynthetic peptidoglycan transglycosylase